ncbi:MAG: hypothetical protein VYA69_12325 [Gemmatimonadota bacterium]|nr:hypothetical protein [Gemmatimonadota bacterium]
MEETRCNLILTIGVTILCLSFAGQARAQDGTTAFSASVPLSLVRKPEAGEVAYFRISREDITVNEVGEHTSRAFSTGRFKREVIHGNEAGSHMEQYSWKEYFYSRSEDTETRIEPVEIAAIRGFSYDLDSRDRHSVPPILIGGLAKTMETYSFFSVAWDVAAITEAVKDRPDYPVRSLRQIGDHITGQEAYLPASFDFTPIVSDFSYVRQPFTATFTGLSTVNETSTALIRFESGASPIAYRFYKDRAIVRLKGREWTSGVVHLNLSDNTISRGELRNTTVISQQAMMPGKQLQYAMTVFQTIFLERITAQEYEE